MWGGTYTNKIEDALFKIEGHAPNHANTFMVLYPCYLWKVEYIGITKISFLSG